MLRHAALLQHVGHVGVRVVFGVGYGGVDQQGVASVLLRQRHGGLCQGVVGARGETHVDAVGAEVLAHLTLHHHGNEFI